MPTFHAFGSENWREMPVDSPDIDDLSDEERGEGDDSGAEQQPKRRQRGAAAAAAAAPKRRKSQADRDCVNPAASRARRVRDNVRTSKILDVLKARADIAAEMINYIVLQQPQEVRDRLRELGFVQLERFAAVRDVRQLLGARCFTALKAIDLRCNEALPYRLMERIAHRFAHDDAGDRIVLATAPTWQGEHNPVLQRICNEYRIWRPNTQVRARN